MLGRLWPRSEDEKQRALDLGYDLQQVLTIDDLVKGDDVSGAQPGGLECVAALQSGHCVQLYALQRRWCLYWHRAEMLAGGVGSSSCCCPAWQQAQQQEQCHLHCTALHCGGCSQVALPLHAEPLLMTHPRC